MRELELTVWREKGAKRETRVLGMLYFINTTIWKSLFGKQADSLQKGTDNDDECRYPWVRGDGGGGSGIFEITSKEFNNYFDIARYDHRQRACDKQVCIDTTRAVSP